MIWRFAPSYHKTVLNLSTRRYTGIIMINLAHQILDTFIFTWHIPMRFHILLGIECHFAAYCIRRIWIEERSHWAITYPILSSIAAFAAGGELAPYSRACSAWVFTAGVFFIGKIPERWGVLAIHSHVLHHICIVIAVTYAFETLPRLGLVHQAVA
jgi:hypothetical protein